MQMIHRCVLALTACALTACNLDLKNPNQPNDTEVVTNTDGVIALGTGLQARFALSYFNFAYAAGLVTDEFASTSAALISISDAEQGSVAPGTGISDNVFNSIYRTVRTADDLLAGSDRLAASLEPGTRSGLRALALTLKAEALGEAIQSYQRAPAFTDTVARPSYESRAVVLSLVRSLLDSAVATLAAQPVSTVFTSRILTPGLNLPNFLQLLRARYARMAGDDAGALAASNLVARSGPSAFSLFTYPSTLNANPFSAVTGGTNGIAVRRQFRNSMLPQDRRFAYFVDSTSSLTGRVGAAISSFSVRYSTPASTQPVYFPDEALLIKAEALANQGSLTASQAALDSVRTDCTGGRGLDDPKACLPALSAGQTQPQLLAEIYVQRRYELLGTGLRWEDVRRRNAIRGPVTAPLVPVDGQRCWLPYAIGDRNANTNVPADPTEPAVFPAGCPL